MNLVEKVLTIRRGGAVTRCHTVPYQGRYTVAEHSWGVAILAMQLYPNSWLRIVEACLTHDVPELITGDIPSPVIKESAELRRKLMDMDNEILDTLDIQSYWKLTTEQDEQLLICDRLELYTWCIEQLWMGNQFVGEIIEKLEEWFNLGSRLGLEGAALHYYQELNKLKAFPPNVKSNLMEVVFNEQPK